MEQKFVKVAFELELAKRIQNKECDGRIVTRDGKKARIVCWDAEGRDDYILALLFSENREYPVNFMPNGRMVKDERTQSDLMLEIPEYMTIKDGDIVTLGWENEYGFCKWVSIIKSVEKYAEHFDTEGYTTVCLYASNGNKFEMDFDSTSDGAMWANKSTEEEKQKLINELKASKEPKAKEYLKRFFNIEQKQEYEFKPFDKVLVRDADHEIWQPAFFSCKKGLFRTIGCNDWGQCIPYEGNEHLLGTTNEFEEK